MWSGCETVIWAPLGSMRLAPRDGRRTIDVERAISGVTVSQRYIHFDIDNQARESGCQLFFVLVEASECETGSGCPPARLLSRIVSMLIGRRAVVTLEPPPASFSQGHLRMVAHGGGDDKGPVVHTSWGCMHMFNTDKIL
jgi:hypothetical protein